MDLGLKGTACIVTGASSGIGLATARLLAADGAGVLMVARGEEALAEAAASIEGRAETLALDVTDPDAGERVATTCTESFGRVDALVNNAGTSSAIPLERLTDEDWQAQWELNVLGPMRLMRAAAPRMAAGGGGRIVNVASSSGKRPSLTNVAYSVTKAAQLSLSRAFADAWAAQDVLVNAVAPGPVSSPLWTAPGGLADQVAKEQEMAREDVLAATAAKAPTGRMSTEEEVAAVIAFLCSPRASNVSGAAWSVDGGAVPQIV